MSAGGMTALADTLPHAVKAMAEGIRFGVYEEEGTVDFAFERGGFCVEASGRVGGQWHTDGDGYDTPYDDYLTGGFGTIDEMTAYYTDPDTNECLDVPPAEAEAFRQMLESELNSYMRHSF